MYVNVQVTHPRNERSESSISANPLNPFNMVGASKRFWNPFTYAFTLAAYYTFDGGRTWFEAAPLMLLSGWAGTSDPAVAFDNMGNAYLVALAVGYSSDPTDYIDPAKTIGIAVYQSTDGGRSWGPPKLIHQSLDDKQWAAGDDRNPASPYYGNVYAVWDHIVLGTSQLAFARTTDHGTTWTGVGAQPAGSPLPGSPQPPISDSFAPDVSVDADGTIFIVWSAGTAIKFVKSTDGGNSFSSPAVAVSGITPIPSPAQLPGGLFRVATFPAGCTGVVGTVIFAWADYRERVSRIYYCYSNDGGNTWAGGPSGQPLLVPGVESEPDQHDFHPQLATLPDGRIGCAFYEFGPKLVFQWWKVPPWIALPPSIDVWLAISQDNGASFSIREIVTDRPWDPAVDAPFSHGSPAATFIGDYFGLAASDLGFFPFWTDTRTGMQEIFCGYKSDWLGGWISWLTRWFWLFFRGVRPS